MTAIRDIDPPTAFRFLRTEGSPRDVGRGHGRAFGDQVLGSIGVYKSKFDKLGLPWAIALDLAGKSGASLRAFDPELAEELDGIAEGAEVDPREILVINIRTGLTRMVEVAVADMVAMHVADQHGVDLTEARIVHPGDRAPGIVEDARAVRILEDHRPVEAAELALMAAQRRDLHRGGLGCARDREAQRHGSSGSSGSRQVQSPDFHLALSLTGVLMA